MGCPCFDGSTSVSGCCWVGKDYGWLVVIGSNGFKMRLFLAFNTLNLVFFLPSMAQDWTTELARVATGSIGFRWIKAKFD